MHIAIGITLRRKDDGQPWKIKTIHEDGKISLLSDDGEASLLVTPVSLPLVLEEFGPLYELGYVGAGLAPPDPVHLERCPFCGSTHLDPAFWMGSTGNKRENETTGPGCNDCGAQAESVDAWNKRYTPQPVAVLVISKGHNMELTTPARKVLGFGDYYVYPAPKAGT